MPNKKNALKALRQTKKRTIERRKIESKLDTLLHQIKKSLVAQKIENPAELFRSLQKALDKANKKNIISFNRANRIKSRVSKKMQSFIKK
ncbi:MAG: 30S ribosomal protein S20 [Candidatus Magasanikbacteria bacterium GW2011_GWC2_45_8]|uniref:Small ribosomal subunit protein bS20 n=1 Tax=Candidatus Magasanikbacteria bacterium GW2011_GWC2_45_8 TaxID=1619050 RepID=A0A0G1QZD7_9BACT|nr:MAG: 30S ribosomal protein S20 [Candidatus Magasanikbacteria bacterium GW2011_GWC2_45_8]HBW73832.1 30S ribosomal protein S20 [Candidatus Magasanikbacteria bacterium]